MITDMSELPRMANPSKSKALKAAEKISGAVSATARLCPSYSGRLNRLAPAFAAL
jgi:hypothetical protein